MHRLPRIKGHLCSPSVLYTCGHSQGRGSQTLDRRWGRRVHWRRTISRDLCDFIVYCHMELVAWRLLSVVSPLQWHLTKALTSHPFWTSGRPFFCRCFAGPGDAAHLRQSPGSPSLMAAGNHTLRGQGCCREDTTWVARRASRGEPPEVSQKNAEEFTGQGSMTEWVTWGIPAALCVWHRYRGDEATWLVATAQEQDAKTLGVIRLSKTLRRGVRWLGAWCPDAQGFLSPSSALVRAAGPWKSLFHLLFLQSSAPESWAPVHCPL